MAPAIGVHAEDSGSVQAGGLPGHGAEYHCTSPFELAPASVRMASPPGTPPGQTDGLLEVIVPPTIGCSSATTTFWLFGAQLPLVNGPLLTVSV